MVTIHRSNRDQIKHENWTTCSNLIFRDHETKVEEIVVRDSRYGYHEVCTGTTRYVLSVNNVNEFFYLLLIHKAKSK